MDTIAKDKRKDKTANMEGSSMGGWEMMKKINVTQVEVCRLGNGTEVRLKRKCTVKDDIQPDS